MEMTIREDAYHVIITAKHVLDQLLVLFITFKFLSIESNIIYIYIKKSVLFKNFIQIKMNI